MTVIKESNEEAIVAILQKSVGIIKSSLVSFRSNYNCQWLKRHMMPADTPKSKQLGGKSLILQ